MPRSRGTCIAVQQGMAQSTPLLLVKAVKGRPGESRQPGTGHTVSIKRKIHRLWANPLTVVRGWCLQVDRCLAEFTTGSSNCLSLSVLVISHSQAHKRAQPSRTFAALISPDTCSGYSGLLVRTPMLPMLPFEAADGSRGNITHPLRKATN